MISLTLKLIKYSSNLSFLADFRVLVLENGCIHEFDTPKKLLDNPDSLFYAMVKESGLLPIKKN